MKKRIFSVAMAIMLIISLIPAIVVYASDIRVTSDGQEVIFPDQSPTIVDGRTLVPVRGVFEALGFDVDWDGDTRTAILNRHDYQLLITIGSQTFTANGVVHTLDVPAQIIGGRTMLPLRFPLESVGYELDWDGATQTALISTNIPHQPQVPSPIPSPSPVPTPTPEVNTENPQNLADWRAVVDLTRSSINLPNRQLTTHERYAWVAEYEALGGPNDFELEVVRLVNETRARYGLSRLEICLRLMMAARFHVQHQADLGIPMDHHTGPYGGSGGVAAAFGSGWNAANGGGGGGGRRTPEGVVNHWLTFSGVHRGNLLNPDSRSIGLGITNGVDGRRAHNYMLTNLGAPVQPIGQPFDSDISAPSRNTVSGDLPEHIMEAVREAIRNANDGDVDMEMLQDLIDQMNNSR